MKKLLPLLTVTLLALGGFAQDQHFVDSLIKELKAHEDDTTAANILNKLAITYRGNNPDKALDYANKCLSLSEQLGYKKGMGNAYNSMGYIMRMKGDYLQGLEYHKKSMKIYREIGDKNGIASSYNNIGEVCRLQGNYPEALKNYFLALKMAEEIGYKKGIAYSHNNIGLIYYGQGNYPEALKNYFATLKIMEEIGDKQGIVASYNNIGNIYAEQGNYPEALKNHLAALKIREEIGDKQGITDSYNNIGKIYMHQGNYPEALKNHLAALKIREEIGNKEGITSSYINIGDIYTKEKKYNAASEYLNKALSLAKQIGSLERIKYSYEGLADLDSAQGNFNKALEHYKLFITFRDSLVNNENTKKTVQMQMQYDFDKKESLTKAEQDKKDILTQSKMKQQRNIRNSVSAGLAIVLLFSVVVYRQRNKISKEKKRSDDLLLNILPAETAEELKQTGSAKAKSFNEVTVMFTDFKNFTQAAEKLNAEELVNEINYYFSEFDKIISKYNIEKIKTIGDSYMCAGGLPVANKTNAEDIVLAALDIQQLMHQHRQQREQQGQPFFEIRIGVHTGPVVAGIVGIKKFAYDIWGDTVNIASRMESSGEPGKINISGSTYQSVKDKFHCEYRGKVQAKNKGEIDMYFVERQN